MTVATAPTFVRETLPMLVGVAKGASVYPFATRHAAPAAPVCFDELLVGCPCASLDEYNKQLSNKNPALIARLAMWRLRLMALVLHRPEASLAWLAHSRQTDGRLDGPAVILTDRRGTRKWLNVEQSRHRLLELSAVRSARVVRWDGMTLREQMLESMAADVMVGIDGTNLANALWMRNGSVVIDLLPYGARQFVPDLSENFRRLWDAAGVAVLWSHSTRHDTYVHDARCADEVWRNVTLSRKGFDRCNLLDANAWISPERVRALVQRAIEKRALGSVASGEGVTWG